MRILSVLVLMGVLTAQDLPHGESQQPKPKKEFRLTYWDIRSTIHDELSKGTIVVSFDVNEEGIVENPIIMDTFDISLNDVIIDKVKQSSYHPATQNGIPVAVRYQLPIRFK